MPHFHIDYSANLDEVVDMGALCEAIRETAAEMREIDADLAPKFGTVRNHLEDTA